MSSPTDMERVVAAIEDLTDAIEGLQSMSVVEPQPEKESVVTESEASEEGSQTTEDPPGTEEDMIGSQDVVDYLYSRLSEDVVDQIECDDYPHAGTRGVRVVPGDELKGTSDYDMLKAALGANEDDSPLSYHIGFDGECYQCGEEDGEFWLFVPSTATELVE